jgi:multidrug efflux pump subunit AcrB
MPKKYLDTYQTIVGQIREERGYDPFAKRGTNFAQINVYLTPYQKRDKTAGEIMEMLKPELNKIFNELKKQDVEKLYFKKFKEGPPVGRDIDIRIRGEDFSIMKLIVSKIENYLTTIRGITSISDNFNLKEKEIRVLIDKNKATKFFLTNSDIAFAIRCAFRGIVATTIKRSKAEKEVEVLVRLPKEERSNPKVFEKILIRNKFDDLIPLKEISKIQYCQTLRSIKHLNGKRFISVVADVDNRYISSFKANQLIKKKFKDISKEYLGYTLHFGGEGKETMESLFSLLRAFFVAILAIFLILATLFHSLLQPFIVMLTIPFALIGVVFAFLIHFQPLSFLALLGLVGLSGVVVNDSIVLVDFINRLRKAKKDLNLEEVIKEACSLRLRPVILTTITTICGLATVAYGIGGMDPFLRPMALSISWGLLFATFSTLIVIPCVYLIGEDIKNYFIK